MVMMPVAMMIVVMMPVVRFDNIAAASCYSLWKWCNGRGVGRPVSGHKSERSDCKREDHPFHFSYLLGRSKPPPYDPLNARAHECALNKIWRSNF
jgi:hypothetical protein